MSVVIVSILLCFSISDIKERKISIIPLVVIILFSLGFFFWKMNKGEAVLTDLLWNQIPGMFFLGMALISRDKIGYGDGLILLFLGNFVGYQACILVLFFALIISCVFSIGMLLIGKVKLHSGIAFVPFLLIGYLGYLLLYFVGG